MISRKGYSLPSINKIIMEMIEKDTVNHLEFFVAKDSSKLSVTLDPYKACSEGQNALYSYHGLHPSFDAQKLNEFLFNTKKSVLNREIKREINNEKAFWREVHSLQEEFGYMKLIGEEKVISEFQDTDTLETLLGRAILQMASHFGVEVQVSKEAKDFVSDLNDILCEHTKC